MDNKERLDIAGNTINRQADRIDELEAQLASLREAVNQYISAVELAEEVHGFKVDSSKVRKAQEGE